MNLLIETPFFWRTLRARDHVTRARYFQIFMSQLLLTRTNFLFTFFSLFGKSFGNFIPRLFAALSFNLLALNLEFEPITQRELFLTAPLTITFLHIFVQSYIEEELAKLYFSFRFSRLLGLLLMPAKMHFDSWCLKEKLCRIMHIKVLNEVKIQCPSNKQINTS